jgi:hypothetical protein
MLSKFVLTCIRKSNKLQAGRLAVAGEDSPYGTFFPKDEITRSGYFSGLEGGGEVNI